MAFPILKMENKNPQNVPFRLDYVDPNLIQQCLGPPHGASTTPNCSFDVEAPSHTYAVKSPLDTMARPKFVPKVPLTVDPLPNPSTCIIPGLARPTCMLPNGIRIRSAVILQCTEQTDRSFTGKFDDYRPLC